MDLKATKVALQDILPLRSLFLQENNFQIRYNACHERGWTDSYILSVDDITIGYGSVNGQNIPERDTIFEFYLIPPYRSFASQIFPLLIAASGAKLIECQSNELLLSSMLYEFSKNIYGTAILFQEDRITNHQAPDVVFRSREEYESMFHKKVEDDSGFVLEKGGEIVAKGGFLLHYNKPFADLYMEVKEDFRRTGLGAFIIQEVKKACYLAGRVPAARCNVENKASKATLLKGGLKVAGCMLIGEIKV